ncbi:Acetylxylan esterase, partial [Lachnellula suecica]
MRTSSLLILGLGLSNVCIAAPSLPTKLFAAIKAGNPTASGNSTASAANTTCATGVHMIVARASTESPGQGIIGAVATQVQQAVPGSDSEAVDYPATLTNYTASEASGVAGMQKLIQDYAARCPNSKMALLGYSQGAQVAADVMCGTSSANFNSTPPLDAALSKNIVAVIQMGDPTHVPALSQDVGNSTKAGIFPRLNTAACGTSAALTQSYCNADDKFCDSGNSIQVHISYVQAFGTQAAQFVTSKVQGNGTK